MGWPNLQRARSLERGEQSRKTLYTAGLIAAVLMPVLVVNFGLIVQVLVNRAGNEVPQDIVLRTWVNSQGEVWPQLERPDSNLIALLGIGVGIAMLESFALFFFHRAVQRAAQSVASQLKTEIRSHAYRRGLSDILGTHREIPERLFTQRVEDVRRGLVDWWQVIPRSAVTLIALLTLTMGINLWLAILAMLLTGLVFQRYVGFKAWTKKRSHYWRARGQRAHNRLIEDLHLVPLTTGHSLERVPGDSFATDLLNYEKAAREENKSDAINRPLLFLSCSFGIGFLLLIVGLSPNVTVAGIAAFVAALLCCVIPINRLLRLKEVLHGAETAAHEIFEFLDQQSNVTENENAIQVQRMQREIRLIDVSLSNTAGQRILDQLTFGIPAGQRIAMIASDAETTAALAGLLVRFYDPATGRIMFDDVDIRTATLDTVRGQAIFVPADGWIFSGTISENVGCGDSGFTKLQLADATKQACAANFIDELLDKYDTVVGEHGYQLSPSQAFRLGLARASLRNPSVIVVEEPAIDIDATGPNELDDALDSVAQDRTLIVLASRLATLRAFDCIYVFHQGQLHARGEHTELIQRSELYRHVNYQRFNPFRNHEDPS